jgi:hypothetical protein
VIKDKKIRPVQTVKEFKELVGKADEIAVFVQPSGGPGHFETLTKEKKN